MKRRRKDSGFAMMLVILMAASIAITLYMEIPRIAFEAERQHELLLVDRGNQFKRAIQVFVTDKTNNPMRRWPASLDELESFNNHRYLRRRYIDPMTGKDEWRLVHINGGVLTDSVTNKPTGQNGQNGQSASGSSTGSSGSTYLSTQAYMDVPTGDDGTGGATAGVNRALNRRPSDAAGAPGELSNPGGAPTGALPGMPGAPGTYQPGMAPGLPGQPGFPGQAGTSGGLPATAPPGTDPSSQQAGAGFPGATGSIGAGGPGAPGMPGGGQNPQSSAAGMINNLLTTPRPGGMPTNMPGSTVGGGIAGVASKFKAEGIMVINERTKINEWEFLFDLNKYRPPPNPIAGAVGTPQQQQQNGTGNTNNGTATTPTTPPPITGH